MLQVATDSQSMWSDR